MNSWSNDDLAKLLRPQQPITTSDLKPPRPNLAGSQTQGARPALRAVPSGPESQAPSKAPGALSQQEIDALMRALKHGTELRLHRQATPEELQRLINAVNSARRLELLAAEAMYGGASVHWSGTDWVFERPVREQRAA